MQGFMARLACAGMPRANVNHMTYIQSAPRAPARGMKRVRGLAAAALVGGALGGCAVAPPPPPPVVAVPGASKTFAQFQQDDLACRNQAKAAATGPAASPQQPSGTPSPPPAPPPERIYADCMVARGNTVQPPAQGASAVAYPAGYPVYGYDPWLYGDPAFYGFWGEPYFYGFYGGGGFIGHGYYPGRYFAGHPMGFYHGGGFGRGGGFAGGGHGGGFAGGGHGGGFAGGGHGGR